MGFGHEKLDVYRAAIEYVGWAYHYCETLKGHRNAKDQLLRASQAIPLNVNEESAQYSVDLIDSDTDTDPETDKSQQQQFPRVRMSEIGRSGGRPGF